MAFTKDDLVALDDFLAEAGTVTYLEAARGRAQPGDIAMRHDVDHSIEKAHRFAQWEATRSIVSTYFILTTAPYYDDPNLPNYLNEMIEWGHEIGFHNDAMCAVDGDVVAAAEYILHHKRKIEEMLVRDYTLLGIADHGGPPHRNGDIWQHYSPQDLGFEYEAYQLQRSTTTLLTDNRGKWRGPLRHAQTFMLIHPTWWPV